METKEKKPKKSVRIRQEKEAKKAFREQNEGNLGASRAHAYALPSSPRKMRLVADMIRGQFVLHALHILDTSPQLAARNLKALLTSALANWKQQNANVDLDQANLYVKEIFVDGGRMLKRMRPAPQGRGYRVRKRSNHVTIVLDSLNEA
ncbi:MAG: 50S ribosomal protein L22 [Bacteroidetes bacterium]|jgi:large subunit ribosomal protein L22|nr:MAG: 50S ribosomal protein L22 [Bacteroidota bacterium]